jgi:dihydroxy-acid dehydratase
MAGRRIVKMVEENQNHLHLGAMTVTGRTVGQNIEEVACTCYNTEVIACIDKPLIEEAGIAVLKGNLCEDGAVIKPSAATPALMQHRGQAVVFESIEDYHARIRADLLVQPQ